MKRLSLLLFLAWSVSFPPAYAQPAEKLVKVIVAPDRDNWLYKPGEKVKLPSAVLRNGNPIKDGNVRYEIGPEKMQARKKETTNLAKGSIAVDGGTLKSPGFLRCTAIAEFEGVE